MAKSTTFKGQAKPMGKSGHFYEPRRHSLQAKGIKTGRNNLELVQLPYQPKAEGFKVPKQSGQFYALPELEKFYAGARMSPALKNALDELIDALKHDDWSKAEELSAVKSFITSEIEPADNLNHFQEDMAYNRRKFKDDLYSYLDSLHFDLAMRLHKQPSGIMILSRSGIQDRPQPTLKSPTLNMMRWEHKQIEKGIRWNRVEHKAYKEER